MGLFQTVRRWIDQMLGKSQAVQEFGIKPILVGASEDFIHSCLEIYAGRPSWKSEDIRTVNFAQSVASEVARLTTLAISVKIDGSPRAGRLQDLLDKRYYDLRKWTEYAAAGGTVILKPNGKSVDIVHVSEFLVTETDGEDIRGAIFSDTRYDAGKEKYYTRLEYHRFKGRKYLISNRCYIGDREGALTRPVPIDDTPWTGLAQDIAVENIEKPLFAVFRMPGANNLDPKSVYALPIFAAAVTELESLDIAYSRNDREIRDSKRTVLLDSDRLMPSGTPVKKAADPITMTARRNAAGLPDYVKMIEGNGKDDLYHEINPALNTDTRLDGINALLSQIGYKCGFSNGYFVFNERTGMVTATQVESDDRRTIQLIKDVRDQLEKAVTDLVYAMSKLLDLEGEPAGDYDITFDFGDITYNREEDRVRWWGYVVAGKVPFWYYLTKFEGFSEEDARAIEAEAQPDDKLFGEEE